MNKWQIAKKIQSQFWCEFNLIITRDQAFEVASSMKHQYAGFALSGNYSSTVTSDDIRQASPQGVHYGGYKTFNTTREWNDAVIAGDFCPVDKINNPHAIEYDPLLLDAVDEQA